MLSVSFLAIQFVFVVSVSWRALVLPHRADQGFDRFAINHAIFLTANARITCFPYMAEILPAKQKSRICAIGKSGSCDCYVFYSIFTISLSLIRTTFVPVNIFLYSSPSNVWIGTRFFGFKTSIILFSASRSACPLV